jgi:hypothetical protein
MVANPDITPFWGNFRVGGNPTVTSKRRVFVASLDECFDDFALA